MNEQRGKNSSGVPLAEIMRQIYDAAGSDPGVTDLDSSINPLPINARLSMRTASICHAVKRAYQKSFVHAAKPLRRLLRNQGAVNDSMIEALFDLASQNQEMLDEMTALQTRLNALEAELKELRSKAVETRSSGERA